SRRRNVGPKTACTPRPMGPRSWRTPGAESSMAAWSSLFNALSSPWLRQGVGHFTGRRYPALSYPRRSRGLHVLRFLPKQNGRVALPLALLPLPPHLAQSVDAELEVVA